MAVDTPDRQKLYPVFRVLNSLYPDDVDYLSDLKNIVCASEGEFTRDPNLCCLMLSNQH